MGGSEGKEDNEGEKREKPAEYGGRKEVVGARKKRGTRGKCSTNPRSTGKSELGESVWRCGSSVGKLEQGLGRVDLERVWEGGLKRFFWVGSLEERLKKVEKRRKQNTKNPNKSLCACETNLNKPTARR